MKTPSRKDGDSVALDDLKREMLFHRQAQSAVIEGISRLNSLRVPTQRPDDYFAEMAKSDKHMHKVEKYFHFFNHAIHVFLLIFETDVLKKCWV